MSAPRHQHPDMLEPRSLHLSFPREKYPAKNRGRMHRRRDSSQARNDSFCATRCNNRRQSRRPQNRAMPPQWVPCRPNGCHAAKIRVMSISTVSCRRRGHLVPSDTRVLPMQTRVMPMQSPVIPMQTRVMPMQSRVIPTQSRVIPTQSRVLPPQRVSCRHSACHAATARVMPTKEASRPKRHLRSMSTRFLVPRNDTGHGTLRRSLAASRDETRWGK